LRSRSFKNWGVGVLKIEESELLCTDSTALYCMETFRALNFLDSSVITINSNVSRVFKQLILVLLSVIKNDFVIYA
jgi:hypothetical protein